MSETVKGPEDSIVSEMIQQLPRQKSKRSQDVLKIVLWGWKIPPSPRRTAKLVFLRQPDAAPKKGIISCRCIALTSVMSTWCAICVILRLAKEKELEGWTQLHVG